MRRRGEQSRRMGEKSRRTGEKRRRRGEKRKEEERTGGLEEMLIICLKPPQMKVKSRSCWWRLKVLSIRRSSWVGTDTN